MTREEALVALLREKGYHISFAESCTAGLLAATLVNVSGASDVFDAAFVTYANEAKMRLVGVKEETLAAYGAVSEQTAREMADGCAREAGAELGVGVSGLAGPGGGTPQKPVGTVCFGFHLPSGTVTDTAHFENNGREGIRQAAVAYAIDRLLLLLSANGD